jgi:hypothetical protein
MNTADFAGAMSRTGIKFGSKGRSPGKPETTRLGHRVGKTKGDHTESRNIQVEVKDTKKGHKRSLKRPVHQGASKSSMHITPTARGADKFSFGTIPQGEAGWKKLPWAH